ARPRVSSTPGRLREYTRNRTITATTVQLRSGYGSWHESLFDQDWDRAWGSGAGTILWAQNRESALLFLHGFQTTINLQKWSASPAYWPVLSLSSAARAVIFAA